MRHDSLSIGIIAIACGLSINAGTALAANETWVSGTGTDAGNCPRTAPCRTFQFAHDQTNNNGAINVLSSGNFGPVTITKPISIVAEGVEAVINTDAGGAAIIVQAGGGAIVLPLSAARGTNSACVTRASKMQYTNSCGMGDSIGAAHGVKLLQQRCDVILRRMRRNTEAAGNQLV